MQICMNTLDSPIGHSGLHGWISALYTSLYSIHIGHIGEIEHFDWFPTPQSINPPVRCDGDDCIQVVIFIFLFKPLHKSKRNVLMVLCVCVCVHMFGSSQQSCSNTVYGSITDLTSLQINHASTFTAIRFECVRERHAVREWYLHVFAWSMYC